MTIDDCVKQLLGTRYPKHRQRQKLIWVRTMGEETATEIQRRFNTEKKKVDPVQRKKVAENFKKVEAK